MCEFMLAPLPLANSIICFLSGKAKPQYLFFQGANTELPRKTISCWEGWRPTGILWFSDASVWKRKLPICFSKKGGKYCPSLCSPDHRETCPIVVQEVAGCSPGATLRAVELGFRTQAVPICAEVRTPASLIKKLMGLWHPQDAVSVHPCIRKNTWFSMQTIKPILGGKEFLLMERAQIHTMLCLYIKINYALHFQSAVSLFLIAFYSDLRYFSLILNPQWPARNLWRVWKSRLFDLIKDPQKSLATCTICIRGYWRDWMHFSIFIELGVTFIFPHSVC